MAFYHPCNKEQAAILRRFVSEVRARLEREGARLGVRKMGELTWQLNGQTNTLLVFAQGSKQPRIALNHFTVFHRGRDIAPGDHRIELTLSWRELNETEGLVEWVIRRPDTGEEPPVQIDRQWPSRDYRWSAAGWIAHHEGDGRGYAPGVKEFPA